MTSQIQQTEKYKNVLQWRIPMALLLASFFFTAIFYYFYYEPTLYTYSTALQDFVRYSGMWAIGIALLTVLGTHIRKIIKKGKSDWYWSIVTLIPMGVMLAVGFGSSRNDPIYRWIIDQIITPLSYASMMLDGWYLTIVLYRVFRVRNIGMVFMFLVFVITSIAVSPLGAMLVPGSFDFYVWLRLWVQTSTARSMAIIGITSGVSATIRILLGRERGLFAGMGGRN